MTQFKVTVLPENLTVEVDEGTSLLIAAQKAGVTIESPCGGRGTCGKCAVKVLNGEVEFTDHAHLSTELKQGGFILACQARVIGDVEIEVPLFSRLTGHQVELNSKATKANLVSSTYNSANLQPICRKVCVKLDKPDLSDIVNDLDRLKAVLSKDYNTTSFQVNIKVLQKLPFVLRQGLWEVCVTIANVNGCTEIIDVEAAKDIRPTYGLAIDIGTTTVAVYLINLDTGKVEAKQGTYNKQAIYGSDVISRIIYTDENVDGMDKLQEAIIVTINELIEDIYETNGLNRKAVKIAVCAGNTVMTHLFLKVSPKYLRLEPYIPAATNFPAVKAETLGLAINSNAPVITVPSVASYVGGDITSGVLATGFTRSEKLTLFIDIGTNGELVLGNNEWLATCACSAGPAFEGSGISCGMRAMDGAIDHIDIDIDTLEVKCRTIGNKKALGICGSGLIYSLSEMIGAEIIDRAGKINEGKDTQRIRRGDEGLEYVIVWADESGSLQDIVITEGDVKNLLRAKGAIFAGIRCMLQQVQLSVEDIERVYIAGGFGNYINIEDAINIGLLPDLPIEKYEFVGNTSLQGAMLMLLHKDALDEALKLANHMTYLELSVGNLFMDEFISAMFIPHTDLSLFPSTKYTTRR